MVLNREQYRMQRAADQMPIEEMLGELWDVLVIGAGPAGSTLSFQLASRGVRVLLVDRCRFPREKPCGDALAPDALNAIDRMGLLGHVRSQGHALPGLRVYSGRGATADIDASFVTLRRRRLDELLAMRAVDAGAGFARATVEALRFDSRDHVESDVTVATRPIRSRLAVVATGANLSLLDRLGLVQKRQSHGFALRCYLRSSLVIDRLVFSFEPSTLPGYRWIFPVGQDEYNVGCVAFVRGSETRPTNLASMFDEFVNTFPLTRELFQRGDQPTPLVGARVRCGLRGTTIAAPRVLAIGETIGTTFPVSAEGIGQAMASAEVAARCIAESLANGNCDEPRFAQQIEAAMRPRVRGYEAVERWLSKPWLNEFALQRVARSARLRNTFARVINENLDPRAVFSWKGLWTSVWS